MKKVIILLLAILMTTDLFVAQEVLAHVIVLDDGDFPAGLLEPGLQLGPVKGVSQVEELVVGQPLESVEDTQVPQEQGEQRGGQGDGGGKNELVGSGPEGLLVGLVAGLRGKGMLRHGALRGFDDPESVRNGSALGNRPP